MRISAWSARRETGAVDGDVPSRTRASSAALGADEKYEKKIKCNEERNMKKGLSVMRKEI